jgi:hypothetical protein
MSAFITNAVAVRAAARGKKRCSVFLLDARGRRPNGWEEQHEDQWR